jgi:uncharacterized protein YndB with AHSA1/START domain
MSHFQQSLVINTNPAAAYAALTTLDGLRGWWSQDCDGTPQVGGTLHFRFDCASKDVRIEQLKPQREVRWLCTRAHIDVDGLTRKDEWVGTELVFRLAPEAGGTRLDFEHVGLTPTLECYELCNKGWRYFLDSLHMFLETGRGTPHVRAAAAA